jgi:hypothetical protein
MTYLKLIFLFILVLLDRCGIIRRNVTPVSIEEIRVSAVNTNPNGTWRLTNMPNRPDKDSIRAGESANAASAPVSIITFFPDSTFTEVRSDGYYLSGTWKYAVADSSITLLKKGKESIFRTSFGNESNGLRLLTLINDHNQRFDYAGFGKSLDLYREDPFYDVNNTWRLKPASSENKQQVLARLRGYLFHSALLLKAADTRRQQIISWEFSQGILKIYRSGIGLVPRNEIPETWINCYHSTEEALLAYEILEDFLLTTSYKGEATGNWVKDDYNILISTYERLKTRNLASFKAI